MYKIYKISNQISFAQRSQLISLVTKNAHTISSVIFKTNSPLYEYFSLREIARTNRYLDRIGEAGASGASLIVTEDKGNIIGYILYHCTTTNEKDISIASTIVDQNYRRQGILKNMMDILKSENEGIALTCFVEKVQIYEKLGFKVIMQQDTQICLCYGAPEDGEIYSVDDNYIDQDSSVKLALSKFKKQYNLNWRTIWNELLSDCKTEIQNAEKFIKNLG